MSEGRVIVEKERQVSFYGGLPFEVRRLEFYDIRCFGAFGAVNNVECHVLTFSQRLEAAVLDVGKVDKNIPTVFLGNESKSLGIIEPLYGSFCHSGSTSFCGY
jgi:hypothetical protein